MGRRAFGIALAGAFMLAFLAHGVLAATPLEEGLAAYKKKDFTAALAHFQPLADKGDPYAAFNLGVMYEKGQGVKQNPVLSYKWYTVASTRYAPVQLEQRNQAIAEYTRVSKKMTPEEISEAQKEAKEWKPKA